MDGALHEPDKDQQLTPDLKAARQFLFLLASPLEIVGKDTVPETKHTFFVVGDSDAAKKLVRAESRYGTLSQHAAWLIRQNQRGAGVFVCIQEMDASGDRKEANFKRIRTLVADHDHGIPETPPPGSPTMIVKTSPGKQHVYFVVGEEISKEEYVDAQRWLTEHWGNDKQVKDVTRVMRLPGFYHRKSATSHLVTYDVPDDEPSIYSRATILAKFPAPQKKTPSRSLTVSADQLPSSLIKSATPKRYTLLEVEEALRVLEADDRTDWVDYGHAIKRDHGEAGLDVWLDWSSKSTLFDDDDARRRWAGFDVSQDGPDKIHCGTIVQRARQTKANTPLPSHNGSDELMKELAGDEKAEMLRGDLQDPRSLKNVAIFLLSEKIRPWCNEFDSNYYLRDANDKDTKLSDVSLRDLEMKMYRKGLRVSTDFCEKAVTWLGDKRTAHPVRFYLDNLEWDGVERLDNMLHTYTGAEDSDHNKLVGSKWMIAAVRRVRKPGCKFDTTLVFDGPQGAGKSSFFRTLASVLPDEELFTDGVNIGEGAKETIELTSGKWIVEAAELSGLSERSVNQVKQSLSKQYDNARLAYGRFTTEVPRQFVFGGTTNDPKYLRDKSGNRRFWCVTVGKKIDIAALERDRDQLWAEAASREEKGELIYLRDAEYDLAVAEQAKREEDDPLEIQVEELLSDFECGRVWTSDLYKVLGFDSARKGGATVGKHLGRIMSKLGWHADRGSREEAQRRCFVKRPTTVAEGCSGLPPLQTLKLDKLGEGFVLR